MKKAPLILLPLVPAAAATAQERPNVVLILADDMGYSDIGCMGSEIETPNIDALSSQGVLMTNFCNVSKSCPSRAALLTGLYSWRAGMGAMTDHGSSIPAYQGWLNENTVTIAEVLKDAGYHTYISGKWHVGDAEEYWPEHRGFEQTFHIPNGGGVYYYPSMFPQRKNRKLYRNGEEVFPEAGWYSTDGFGDVAVEFIRRPENQETPFFLYVPFVAPHYPLQAKPEDIEKYRGRYDAGYEAVRTARFEKQKALGILDGKFPISEPEHPDWNSFTPEQKARESERMAVYAAQIDCIDQNVGRIVDALKEQGLYNNTVIIFLSDNGAVMHHFDDTPEVPYGGPDCWASVGKWQNVCNTPFRQGKGREYEGGIKTPLIISWPAGFKRSGYMVKDYAHITDVLPTIIELTGATYPKEREGHQILSLDGRSFLPLLEGRHINRNRPLFFEHMGWKGMRQGRWKLVKKEGAEPWELYDLKKDPYENHDLSARRKWRTRRMARKWQKWAEEVGVEPWPLTR
ncbi:MAG: arylsulfatase [Bacteroidales bacterium]|nr:arylsulfatase [Bacteroidales bacterium]